MNSRQVGVSCLVANHQVTARARSDGSLGRGSVLLTDQGAVLQDQNTARLVTVAGAISSPRQVKILSQVQGPSRPQDGRQVTYRIGLKFIQEDQQAINLGQQETGMSTGIPLA